ncbi:stem bromelain-like [Oryza glaberrima]|uniref:stem bromelain-like n=1 Tax=Oryza glaberrima TaxID=4538 RepID=UPI00224C57C2|nr:stem bromelain-like [Oryza glaberrima]
MKKTTLSLVVGLWAVLLVATAAAQDVDLTMTDKDLESEESMWNLYERWCSVYYASSSSRDLGDVESRFEAFKANARYVSEFNKKEGMTYELGLNKFADMTLDEFVAMYAGAKLDAAVLLASIPEAEEVVGDVPTAWDWRQHGIITPVKSLYTYAIATGKLYTLSEQQVLDCSGDGDCVGGNPSKVLTDFAVKKGIALSQYYPAYSAAKQACRTAAGTPVVKMDCAVWVPSSNEVALKQSVYKQPVSVLIETNSNFQLYRQGVYNGPCGTSVSHTVIAVGYGVTQDNIKYWTVRNSWGPGWGESGYIRMKRDIAVKEELCGIAMYGMYPIKRTAAISSIVDVVASY